VIPVIKRIIPWLAFIAITGSVAWHFGFIFFEEPDKSALLPGETTHGHYQIELACTACHDQEDRENVFTSSGVSNQACNACHGEDLDKFGDSHPTRKFKNPENAIFLEHIDAMSCVACHQEHNAKVTGEMAVTVPTDYCAHCHQVTLENLESHKDLKYNTCANTGCHNYHDNIPLAPSFQLKHFGEPRIMPDPRTPEVDALARWLTDGNKERNPLKTEDIDAPTEHAGDSSIISTWLASAHAKAGINCSDCHEAASDGQWVDKPDHNSCNSCHGFEVEGFLKGKHGMRLAHSDLPPMTPGEARIPMKDSAAHKSLDCSSCHTSHSYDRQFASFQACIQCHDDEHTRSYQNSAHFRLWQSEVDGNSPANTGVSCATCHLPAHKIGDHHGINHNQNANLTPNDKMLRSVCMNCHGLQFSMDSLADTDGIKNNFSHSSTERHPSIDWSVNAAVNKGKEDIIQLKEWLNANPDKSRTDYETSDEHAR